MSDLASKFTGIFADPKLNPPNPKQRHGAAKAPLSLIPSPALVMVAEVFRLGATKYGPYNWRETSVEARTYVDAAERHLRSWFDGEEIDVESGQSHLAHAIACMSIILDAQTIGMLIDNRPPAGATADLIRKLALPVAANEA